MAPVTEPFPISQIAGRYLLFDVDVISHVRRHYNICGVLIGTIPNLSQQNVFLGIPLELLPEESRVLVEQGHAYIVDDVKTHRKGFMEMSREDRLKFLEEMDQQGMELAISAKKTAEAKADKALKQKGLERVLQEKQKNRLRAGSETSETVSENISTGAKEISLFDSTSSSPALVAIPDKKLDQQYVTPTTSHPLLIQRLISSSMPLPDVPRSFPLFKYVHSKGYFSMPGIRFGCHYSVYPGDPLRFHSHFLATGMDWDQEFDLLDIVGGGRLGTGVKKAYLIGGEDFEAKEEAHNSGRESVRAFSIEWAGL